MDSAPSTGNDGMAGMGKGETRHKEQGRVRATERGEREESYHIRLLARAPRDTGLGMSEHAWKPI